MKRLILAAAASICVAIATVLAAPASAASVLFDFEDQVFGADTPLSIVAGPLTADFASPADPGAFAITSAFGLFPTMAGNILASPGSAFVNTVPLTITFNQPVRAVSFQFGLGSAAPGSEIDLTTNAGGSASGSGTVHTGTLLPEGTLSFSGAYFTSLTLSSNTLDFGIDNLQVNLPEPASLAVLGFGLLALSRVRRRAR